MWSTGAWPGREKGGSEYRGSWTGGKFESRRVEEELERRNSGRRKVKDGRDR